MISNQETELKLLPKVETTDSRTGRPISEGAEKWLGVPIKCLDHGFVYLVDYMGNDEAIEQAARVSYGRDARPVSDTQTLLRYLLRNDHTSPFEMASLKFHAKMPILTARQWVRHRTAKINEISGRYSKLPKEYYVPEPEVLAEQSKSNKQGRGKALEHDQALKKISVIKQTCEEEYAKYEGLLNDDGTGQPIRSGEPMVAREIARGVLGTNFYTEWYWKIDLHNFMHFSKLRTHPHAQYEIRVYAEAMARIAKEAFPITWRAFEDYERQAMRLSAVEKKILAEVLREKGVRVSLPELMTAAKNAGLTNKREKEEMAEKWQELGLLTDI